MESATSQISGSNGMSISPPSRFEGRPVLAFGALIAVNAMWAFQFAGARIATEELGAILVTLLPLALATLLVAPFAKLNLEILRARSE